MPDQPRTLYQTIQDAVADFVENGYDSEERLERWLRLIQNAARREMVSDDQLMSQIREMLGDEYRRLVDRNGILRLNPGVDRFTVTRLQPRLREELNRRILASADLIKLNREKAIAETLQRFSGWASSVPAGGSTITRRRRVAGQTREAAARLSFVQRRVTIDQGHKMVAALSNILAVDGGAIAGEWRQHYTRNPRKAHTDRQGKIFTIRGNWALERGLMRAGPDGYTDEIEQPAELVFCRCTYRYLHHLRQLPDDMLTNKGREALLEARRQTAA